MDCGVLPYLASSFKKPEFGKELHESIGKTLLQLGYQKNDRKLELVKQGFVMGLVPLLIHYSSKQHYDPEMCSIVLKCMANFSIVP